MQSTVIRFLTSVLLCATAMSAVEVNITAGAASVTEGGQVTITATRSSNVSTLTVPIALVGPPSYATLSDTDFNFAAGATTATVTLTTIGDTDANGARQITAQIALRTGLTSTNPAVTIGVRDDDVRVALSALDVLASEGALSADTAALLIHLEDTGSGRAESVTVQFEVHGTARFEPTGNNDFSLELEINGTTDALAPQLSIDVFSVTFPVGENDAIVTLTAIQDSPSEVEGGETCIIRLPTAGLAYTVEGADSGIMTIADDDNRIATMTSSPAFESGPDGGINITFLSSFPAGKTISIPYSISGAGVSNGTDITLLTGVATLTSGNTVHIPIDALPDTDLEPEETLVFQLLPSADYILPGTPSIQVPLVDIAGMAVIATPTVNAVESVAGTPLDFQLSVTRLPDFQDVDVAVPFLVTGGTASSGDFSIGGAGVTWDAGNSAGVIVLTGTATSGVINITPIDDQIADGDKTVRVLLVSGQSVTVGGAASATGTIEDDEPVLSLTRSGAASAVEGGAGIEFLVDYPGVPATTPRTEPVTVRFTITGSAGAAVADRTVTGTGISLDPDGLGGSVTIPANQLNTTITVTAVTDTSAETVETVTLALSTPPSGAAYRLGTSTTAGVDLVDASTTPTVSISRIADAIEGRSIVCCRVTRTGATTAALTVKLDTPGGTASATDYQALPSSVVIPATAVSASFAIAAVADGADASETIDLVLLADSTYTIGTGSASVTIVDGFADNQIAITSEPAVLVIAINDAWTSTCRVSLPAGLPAGRTRASLVKVTDGSDPPTWLSVMHDSADADEGPSLFTLIGSPPIGTSPGRIMVRLKVQADVDGDGTFELELPQDLLLWVVDDGGAG